jgi:hypothetical protein
LEDAAVLLETDLVPECALALAVEVLDLWAAGCVFRATAANAAGAENTNAKARRAEMGAFKRILKNLEARIARASSTLSAVPSTWK